MSDHPKTILLLEDNAEFADAVTAALDGAGFSTLLAADSWQALDILEQEQPLDLLLTDIKMPAGMPHGFAVARMAQYKRPELKVLYLTGHPELADGEGGTALGKILRKPVGMASLVTEVMRTLEAT